MLGLCNPLSRIEAVAAQTPQQDAGSGLLTGRKAVAMGWIWTLGGTCFGYRDGDKLWDHEGHHVGTFQGDEVYGLDGCYLGEIKDNLLIIDQSQKSRRRTVFAPYAKRAGKSKHGDCAV